MTTAVPDIDTALGEFLNGIKSYAERPDRAGLCMIGIRTGGVWLARHVEQAFNPDNPIGELNIAFYRDDFSRIGMHPTVEPSMLPFDVNDKHLLLIDDILYTGRTVRAAMNEIFDYGRPASIGLAVLIDRGGRELPIQADVVGSKLALAKDEHVKLLGPKPLNLELCKVSP